jgi:bacteriocin-like protein
MTKEISQKRNSKKDPESLVKTSAEGSVELSEKELQQVAGGQKVKASDKKTDTYLKVELENVLISSYS